MRASGLKSISCAETTDNPHGLVRGIMAVPEHDSQPRGDAGRAPTPVTACEIDLHVSNGGVATSSIAGAGTGDLAPGTHPRADTWVTVQPRRIEPEDRMAIQHSP